jgi:hypothetical protein
MKGDDDDFSLSLSLSLSLQRNEGDVESMRIKLVGLCVCE